jgi:hypothetical protein
MQAAHQTGADPYRTSDLYFAAYLDVAGVPFLGDSFEAGKDGKKRTFLLFEDQGSRVMRDLKNDYFTGRAKVSAQSLVQAIKKMKQLVYED